MAWDMEEAIQYYKKQGAPADQNMLTALLREIQKENGGIIPGYTLKVVSEAYIIPESLLNALIRRIPSLRTGEGHCLELCAGPNCGKSAVLSACAENLHRKSPEKFTLKYVPCMRMCGKGPNIRWDGKLYHRADEKLLLELIGKINDLS